MYNARSFEDAFFHINKKLFIEIEGTDVEGKIKKCVERYQGLKKSGAIF